MFIEIERKFELTNNDYNIIKSNLKLKKKEKIKDIYMDNSEYFLFLNRIFFRKRNGNIELKYRKGKILSEEYKNNDALDKLESFNIKYNELKKLFTIITNREKYIGNLNGKDYIIDIDFHKLGKRYEIEVIAKSEEIGNIFINNIVKNLNLEAKESNRGETKGMLHIKKYVPDLYKKMLNKNYYKKNIV